MSDEPVYLEMRPPPALNDIVAIRFRPGGARPFLRTPASGLVDVPVGWWMWERPSRLSGVLPGRIFRIGSTRRRATRPGRTFQVDDIEPVAAAVEGLR